MSGPFDLLLVGQLCRGPFDLLLGGHPCPDPFDLLLGGHLCRGTFDLLLGGHLSGVYLRLYSKFSDALSSPNLEKTKAHVTASLFDGRDSLGKEGPNL
ncbi:hypothetical protein TNCV_1732481 [Trichonephila clavipes]|nr:hypothetical protein TNCV_1732481 [Trichonephila clavipes]